jgi:orotidine-5'-phosphate decarboxylase
MNAREPKDCLWLAVDVASIEDAKRLVGPIVGVVPNCKIGLELVTAAGPAAAVECLKNLGANVWFDGKFCDIPNTIAGASRAVAALGVDMFDVHVWSGFDGVAAAVANKGASKVLAVTVLTSQTDETLVQLGMAGPVDDGAVRHVVRQMTLVAAQARVDGIVCSPQELMDIGRDERFERLMKITPGIRPAWSSANDQKRVMTPGEAIAAGATAIVIGRPITQPPRQIGTPADAAKRIYDEIASVL